MALWTVAPWTWRNWTTFHELYFIRSNLGLELRVGDLRDLRFEASVDVVTMWHYLEHDPSPVASLEWVRDRMAPGGVAVIEVPDLDGATARWMGRRWPGLHTPRHASASPPL